MVDYSYNMLIKITNYKPAVNIILCMNNTIHMHRYEMQSYDNYIATIISYSLLLIELHAELVFTINNYYNYYFI